jgi:hypothetical protein
MSNESQLRPRPDLFTWSHWSCGAFVGLLALVLVVSLVYGLGRTLWPTTTVVGTLGPVEETRLSNRRAAYHAVLEAEDGDLLVLRLRNNGRILNYLRNQRGGQFVSLRHARGEIWELAPLAPAGPALREFPPVWPGLLPLISGGAVLLYFLGKPWLATLPGGRQQATASRGSSHHEIEG